MLLLLVGWFLLKNLFFLVEKPLPHSISHKWVNVFPSNTESVQFNRVSCNFIYERSDFFLLNPKND